MIRLAILLAAARTLVAAEPPGTMLWVWESPTDLRNAAIAKPWGVAFLLGELHLDGKATTIRPRAQPLRIPPGTYRMGVIRLHQVTDPSVLPKLIQPISAIADQTRVDAIQLDYDAPAPAVPHYRRLVAGLRSARPRMFLSITALLSHCPEPSWLADAPVDETVVMFFRLGDSRAANRLINADTWRRPACLRSAGFSVDEPRPILTPDVPWKRIYLFPGREGWTQSLLERVSKLRHK